MSSFRLGQVSHNVSHLSKARSARVESRRRQRRAQARGQKCDRKRSWPRAKTGAIHTRGLRSTSLLQPELPGSFWQLALEARSSWGKHMKGTTAALFVGQGRGSHGLPFPLFRSQRVLQLASGLFYDFRTPATASLMFDLHEVIAAESLLQRYHFLSQVAAQLPSLQTVVRDDICHLK